MVTTVLINTALICIGIHAADQRAVQAQGKQPLNKQPLKGIDLAGQLHRFSENGDTKAVVVCFLATECPISNGYVPLINDLYSKYRRNGLEIYGVISSHSVTRTAASQHSETFGVQFPMLFDASGELRYALSPTHTPHAFVLSATGKVLYSGAIDDRHVKLG